MKKKWQTRCLALLLVCIMTLTSPLSAIAAESRSDSQITAQENSSTIQEEQVEKEEQDYLSSLKMGANPFQISEIFQKGIREITFTLPGNSNTVVIKPTLSADAPAGSTIKAKWTDAQTGEEKESTIKNGSNFSIGSIAKKIVESLRFLLLL